LQDLYRDLNSKNSRNVTKMSQKENEDSDILCGNDYWACRPHNDCRYPAAHVANNSAVTW